MPLFVYGVFATLAYLLFLPFLFFLSFKQKYRYSIPARFFLKNNPQLKEIDIWFHACSLGETKSLEPLLTALSSSFTITTTTQTGFKEAYHKTPHARYLPFDILLPFWAPKARLLIVTESELWPLLFWSAKRKGAKTLLINARISDHSWPKYRRFSFFYRLVFKFVDIVYAQSKKDAERLLFLGANTVKIGGNIKAYATITPTKTYSKNKQGRIIVAASTHKGEEELIANAFNHIKSPDDTLIVVPRHPERFESVYTLLCKMELSPIRFSEQGLVLDKCLLVDTMGELINLYALADIVILGGSFVPVGGHNPIEPATFGVKLICGPHIFNQQTLFESVRGTYFCQADELTDILRIIDSLLPSSLTPPQGWNELLNTLST